MSEIKLPPMPIPDATVYGDNRTVKGHAILISKVREYAIAAVELNRRAPEAGQNKTTMRRQIERAAMAEFGWTSYEPQAQAEPEVEMRQGSVVYGPGCEGTNTKGPFEALEEVLQQRQNGEPAEGQEPVAQLAYGEQGRDPRDGPRLISYNDMPPGTYQLYTQPQRPAVPPFISSNIIDTWVHRWKIDEGLYCDKWRECFEDAIRLARPITCDITDGMALAFHHALTDGSIGEDELEEIKTGLRAALLTAAPAPERPEE